MLARSRLLLTWLLNHKLIIILICCIIFVFVLGPTLYAKFSTINQRYTAYQLNQVPARKVAIVFGAGVLPDGRPTEYLRNRIQTAVDLYQAHKVQIILMTGDNSTKHYDEPTHMKAYAVQQGVKAADIYLDYAGFNTYDSCYRAGHIFGAHEALLISQGYHLPRAIVTCNGLGVKSIGVAAEHTGRDWTVGYIGREFVSTDKAVIQLAFKPHPTVLGTPLTINR